MAASGDNDKHLLRLFSAMQPQARGADANISANIFAHAIKKASKTMNSFDLLNGLYAASLEAVRAFNIDIEFERPGRDKGRTMLQMNDETAANYIAAVAMGVPHALERMAETKAVPAIGGTSLPFEARRRVHDKVYDVFIGNIDQFASWSEWRPEQYVILTYSEADYARAMAHADPLADRDYLDENVCAHLLTSSCLSATVLTHQAWKLDFDFAISEQGRAETVAGNLAFLYFDVFDALGWNPREGFKHVPSPFPVEEEEELALPSASPSKVPQSPTLTHALHDHATEEATSLFGTPKTYARETPEVGAKRKDAESTSRLLFPNGKETPEAGAKRKDAGSTSRPLFPATV